MWDKVYILQKFTRFGTNCAELIHSTSLGWSGVEENTNSTQMQIQLMFQLHPVEVGAEETAGTRLLWASRPCLDGNDKGPSK